MAEGGDGGYSGGSRGLNQFKGRRPEKSIMIPPV